MSFFQGGLATGMDRAESRSIERGQMEAQQQQAQQAGMQRLNKMIVEGAKQSVGVVQQILEGADTKGIPRSDKKVQQAIQAAREAAAGNLAEGARQGLVPPQALQLYETQINALVDGPTLQEVQALEAEGKGREANASARGQGLAKLETESTESWMDMLYRQAAAKAAANKKFGPGPAQTNIVMPFEKESEKVLGRGAAERVNAIYERGQASMDTLNMVSRMRYLQSRLKEAGGDTGKLQPMFLAIKGALVSAGVDLRKFGINPDTVGTEEAIESLSLAFALQSVQQTKGAISNKEMGMFADAAPGLARTELGNKLILETAERAAKLEGKYSEFIAQKMQESGNDTRQLEKWRQEFNAANPLFTPEQTKELEALVGDPIALTFDAAIPSEKEGGTPSAMILRESDVVQVMKRHNLSRDDAIETLRGAAEEAQRTIARRKAGGS